MSTKKEITTWVRALELYDDCQFVEALQVFEEIAKTSKILFNCAMIMAAVGQHEMAVEQFKQATTLDPYLAIAFFQLGVSCFLLGRFEEALSNFGRSLTLLRENEKINYKQLGLDYQLCLCEVLFNRGLCHMYLQRPEQGMQDLKVAAGRKQHERHDVIDEAIQEEADGYVVFSIPTGILFRPSEAKVRNLKLREYLGEARLIATSDRKDSFTGFESYERKKLSEERQRRGLGLEESPAMSSPDYDCHPWQSVLRPQQYDPRGTGRLPTPPLSGGSSQMVRMSTNESGRVNKIGYPWMPVATDQSLTSSLSQSRSMRGGGKPRYKHKTSLSQRLSSFGKRLRGKTSGRVAADGPEPEQLLSPVSQGGEVWQAASTPATINSPTQGYQEPPSNPAPPHNQTEPNSPASRPSLQQQTERRQLLLKVKFRDDVRFVLIDAGSAISHVEAKIREKIGFDGGINMRVKDDDDMVTLGDQADFNIFVGQTYSQAKAQGRKTPKAEIWVSEW